MSSLSFSLLSWNLHAPCYRKTNNSKVVESESETTWRSRLNEITSLLREEKDSSEPADVICLQEFWFSSAFIKQFDEEMQDNYLSSRLRRTSGKEDGLATLVRISEQEATESTQAPSKFEIINVYQIEFRGVGDRVSQISHLRSIEFKDMEFLVANLHFTFRHSSECDSLRLSQLHQLLEFIEYIVSQHLVIDIPVILIGDFNGCSSEMENILGGFNYECAFGSTDANTIVTHIAHNGIEICADYCWIRSNRYSTSEISNIKLICQSSGMLPNSLECSQWIEFDLSDHRPVVLHFGIEKK